jgi:hypothetical protein
MERRIENAIVFVPKTKDTQSIFFSDKGVRLTVTDDKAVIATGYHQHVFESYNMSGMSRPYLYTRRIVELALENDCEQRDEKGNVTGYSYSSLLDTLNAKEDKAEYNIAYYYDWWLLNIFSPLYGIGETVSETFITYLDYVCVIAKNAIILSEKTEDMTNRAFLDKFIENVKEFTKDMTEGVIFPKKSDEEVMQENIEAVQNEEANESKD